MRKKILIILFTAIFISVSSACGNSIPPEQVQESESVKNIDDSPSDYTENTEDYTSRADESVSDGLNEPSLAYNGKFVPSDNFWQGDDYFDLEAYFIANGAEKYGTDENQGITYYGDFDGWRLMPQSGFVMVLNIDAYYYNYEDYSQRSQIHTAYTNDYGEEAELPTVRYNVEGKYISPKVPKLLDDLIVNIQEHGGDENPFKDITWVNDFSNFEE